MPVNARTRRDSGYSMVEMLVAVAIIGIILVAAGGAILTSVRHQRATEQRDFASNAVQDVISRMWQTSWDNLGFYQNDPPVTGTPPGKAATETGVVFPRNRSTATDLNILPTTKTITDNKGWTYNVSTWITWVPVTAAAGVPANGTASKRVTVRATYTGGADVVVESLRSPNADEETPAAVDSDTTLKAATPCTLGDNWCTVAATSGAVIRDSGSARMLTQPVTFTLTTRPGTPALNPQVKFRTRDTRNPSQTGSPFADLTERTLPLTFKSGGSGIYNTYSATITPSSPNAAWINPGAYQVFFSATVGGAARIQVVTARWSTAPTNSVRPDVTRVTTTSSVGSTTVASGHSREASTGVICVNPGSTTATNPVAVNVRLNGLTPRTNPYGWDLGHTDMLAGLDHLGVTAASNGATIRWDTNGTLPGDSTSGHRWALTMWIPAGSPLTAATTATAAGRTWVTKEWTAMMRVFRAADATTYTVPVTVAFSADATCPTR